MKFNGSKESKEKNLLDIVENTETATHDKLGRTKLGNGVGRGKDKKIKTDTQSNSIVYSVFGAATWAGTVAMIVADITNALGLTSIKYGIFLHMALTIISLLIRKKNGSRACEICAFVNVIASCTILYFVVKEIGIWDNVEIDLINE